MFYAFHLSQVYFNVSDIFSHKIYNWDVKPKHKQTHNLPIWHTHHSRVAPRPGDR